MYKLANYLIAVIWIINGLFCKVFNIVPRHQMIVAGILGDNHAVLLTRAIGIGEISIAIWIITFKYHRLCAIVQIILIATMNTIEFFMVPDLLLFGRFNAVFAIILIATIYYTEFVIGKTRTTTKQL